MSQGDGEHHAGPSELEDICQTVRCFRVVTLDLLSHFFLGLDSSKRGTIWFEHRVRPSIGKYIA